MAKPMIKTEWLNWLEKAWDEAQQAAWSEKNVRVSDKWVGLTDEEIFDLAEKHGWMDDFGRWNFQPDRLVSFALAIKKAEWVGLTDEEIDNAVKSCSTVDTYKYFRAIEAKLKEKNNG